MTSTAVAPSAQVDTRLDAVREAAAREGAEAALISYLPHIRWACGFSGSNGLLLVRANGATLVTDGRYRAQAGEEVQGADVVIASGQLPVALADADGFQGIGRVAIQADHTTLGRMNALRSAAPDVVWEPVSEFLAEAVAQKQAEEVDAIRRAQAITDQVFEDLLPLIRPGVRERELAAEILYRQRRLGAERESFEPIVASGPNAALPHARPTDRMVRPNELVLMDFGCVVDGYASDMTRTVAVGEPGEEMRRVYDIVLRAQAAGLDAVAPGRSGRDIDEAARRVIRESGYGEAFSHSLGHGVGMDVHEWPRLSAQADHVLPVGVVVTVEPGIYLPGRFGIRIEDLIYLGPAGKENLTRSTKALLVLPIA